MEEYSLCAPSAEKPNMAERENACWGICWSWNALNWLLVHLRGIQELKDEKKKGSIGFIWSLSCPTCPTGVFLKIVLCSYFARWKKAARLKTCGSTEKLNPQVCETQIHYLKHNIKWIIETHLCLGWKHNASHSFPTSSCNIFLLSLCSTSVFWCRFPEKRRKWALPARLLINHSPKQATLGKYGICATQCQNFWPPCWHPNSCRHGACLMWRPKKVQKKENKKKTLIYS